MHMLTLLPAEQAVIVNVRNHLDKLARAEIEPRHPGLGICFNMSAVCGVGVGHPAGMEYPQAYLDFGSGLFKLLNSPVIELYGHSKDVDLKSLLRSKRFSSVDLTSYCCVSFGGFDLTGDSAYPIPGDQCNDLWVGLNGTRRRMLCGHIVNVLDEALAKYELHRVREFYELPTVSRDLIRGHLGAFRQVRHNPPAAGKAPATGLCFTVRGVLSQVVSDMEYARSFSDVSCVLKDVSKALLVRELLTYDKLSGGRRTVALRMLDWVDDTAHGHMCKFVGVVALLRHPKWFPDSAFERGGNEVRIQELTDYPIPGGRTAFTSESLDNWAGDQLQCRLALAESCMNVIRNYIKPKE